MVSTKTASVRAEVLMRSRGLYDVTFCPQECVTHFLSMTFNEEDVPNSPFEIMVSKPPNSLQLDESSKNVPIGIANQLSLVYFKTQSTLTNLSAIITGISFIRFCSSIFILIMIFHFRSK